MAGAVDDSTINIVVVIIIIIIIISGRAIQYTISVRCLWLRIICFVGRSIWFDVAQAELLEDHTKDLKRVLYPGARRLNWNSLGINDFISKCTSVCSSY